MKSLKKTKTSIFTLVALALMLCVLAALLGACMKGSVPTLSSAESQQTQTTLSPASSPSALALASAEAGGDTKDEKTIRTIVERFGRVLKNVSLLAPDTEIIKNMEANYAEYVTPDLLANWEGNPSVRAAGRLTSSPWPDRIEISGVVKNADSNYTVSGTLIEVTSTEAQSGSAASTRSVEIKVALSGGKWLISECLFGYSVPANKKQN